MLLLVLSTLEEESSLGKDLLLLSLLIFIEEVGETGVKALKLAHQAGLLHGDINRVGDIVQLLLGLFVANFLFNLGGFTVVIHLLVK